MTAADKDKCEACEPLRAAALLMLETLQGLEWLGDQHSDFCPECHYAPVAHSKTCDLAAAITAGKSVLQPLPQPPEVGE